MAERPSVTVVNADTGQVANVVRGPRNETLIDAVVVGSNYFRREPPEILEGEEMPPRQEWPLLQYPRGSVVKGIAVEDIVLSRGQLKPADEVLQNMMRSPYGITDISGVGRLVAKKLYASNIRTLEAIIETDTQTLAESAEVNSDVARAWQDEARTLIEEDQGRIVRAMREGLARQRPELSTAKVAPSIKHLAEETKDRSGRH